MPLWTGFCLNAEEPRQPSKTNEYDDTILLDLPRHQWLPPLLRRLQAASGHDGLLFPVAYAELSRAFRLAALLMYVTGITRSVSMTSDMSSQAAST